MRSLLVSALAAALFAAGPPAGAAGESAGPAAPGASQTGAVKRATAARCSPRRIAALGTRRARTARRASCRSTGRMSAKTPRRAAWPATPGALRGGGTPVSPAPAGPTAPGTTAPGTTAPVASTIGANAYDIGGFVLRLTRSSVPAGNLTVFFRNNDVSDHDLWIEGPGGVLERISERVGEGGGATRTIAVTPGAWRMFCSLADHDAMTRGLTVTP